MTESDSDGGNEDEPTATVIWIFLGIIAGVALLAKVIVSEDIPTGEPLPLKETALLLSLFLGPIFLFAGISNQLSKEAKRGNISWATYWTTMASITVTAFTLLGIASIDDFMELINAWRVHDERWAR
ncbi:hypothetical protein OH786_00380 [Streptomyces atratus]|uniref:Uncharacterized protein n=1 Tax=Streptomyces atratus TaxID=1893 RepID=A0A1K2F7W2_STRAR|nr:hypothetical protein [Streptomyces atratus]SFY43248.1 hypothetical protein SAMN02787144_10358 [Streptomyces atratus]